MSWSTLRKDLRDIWQRHGHSGRDFGFWGVANHHVGRLTAASKNRVVRVVGGRFYGLCSLAIDVVSGVQINREARIGADFRVVHGWNVKIHPDAIIGDRVGIMHDVTIGTTPDSSAAPIIGNDVFIGAGAKVLGAVRIGDRARIAANSLVITDVPAGATAVGVPARVLHYTGRPDAPTSSSSSSSQQSPPQSASVKPLQVPAAVALQNVASPDVC